MQQAALQQQTDSPEHEQRAGELIVTRDWVPPETKVTTVYDLFCDTPNLEALAIADEGRAVGLITRTKLLFRLARRFGYELHAKHPIMSVANCSPLIVCEDDLLDAVIEKACARPPKEVYDEIIVTDADGKYAGLLSLKELVVQQSLALTRSVLLQEVATSRSRELERMNQVKSSFLANVTHELRSPVNAIVGLTQLLKMSADQGSMEQIRERVAFLLNTAGNLRTVITNILDLSKIEAGKMEVASVEVDVASLVAEIAETTRILIGERPVSVGAELPSGPIVLLTDPIKLRQILTNLAGNAAKFTDHGRIDFRLGQTEVSWDIEVCDTGIGIKEEHLSRIFEAFGQVEDATTKTREGTGLGLTISNNLAKLLGATLTVMSTFGRGTTFTLSLPRHPHNKGE